MRVNAGSGPAAYLSSVSAPATDVSVKLSSDKPASGSGLYLSVIGRRVVGSGDYRAKVRLQANGTVSLSLQRVSSTGVETALEADATIPGLTYAIGDVLNVRLQVTGSSPTSLRARVWKQGTPEPTTWQRAATDNTAALQGPGGVGVYAYLSGGATNAPITVRLDDLLVTAP